VHNNFMEEIAKFRAARRMWAKLMRNRFGAKKEKSLLLRFHTQTAGVTLQAEQPLVNVPRVTIQALAAVLGGTQSLHTNSYDEALALPSKNSATLALRTQQVIAHESGVADFIDPLAGSYAIEALTDEIENRANEYMKKIDGFGGATKAIEQGYQQREIERRAYEHQLAVESKERVVVGTNDFRSEDGAHVDLAKANLELEREQLERLRALRARRSAPEHARALQALRDRTQGEGNLVEAILGAVVAEATVSEISDVMRDTFGTH
jgi:methylmalonyl-CoA mutase N-terminal domain/subunit